jgi:hypothetical protein
MDTNSPLQAHAFRLLLADSVTTPAQGLDRTSRPGRAFSRLSGVTEV